MMMKQVSTLTLLALVMSARPVGAHDLWIEPTTFRPEAGAIVGVRLRVGERLRGAPVPRDPALVNQFVVVDLSGRKPVVGRDGADPAGLFRIGVPGLHIVAYRSNPSPLVLPVEKFNQYVVEEGLESVAAGRPSASRPDGQVRELFSRSAKSLVLNGNPSAIHGDRMIGLPLELVAERNPYTLAPGDELPVRLTYEQRPLAGTLVVAVNGLNPAEQIKMRSDADGRVRFVLPRAGMWLIKAVHMVPAPSRTAADWNSIWASLTFELGGARAQASATDSAGASPMKRP
jgi:Domain of unknown function (DUF4198)